MKLAKGLRKKTTTETTSQKPAGNGHPLSKPVTIEAKVDVGFGNTLYLRGEGTGLNWNRGVPLTCVDRSTWKWSGETSDRLKFKLLLNDTVWAKGDDLIASPGEKVEVVPAF